MKGSSPQPLPGERGLVKRPIAVNPCNPSLTLDPMSRLNFGKLYTVEHNVRLRDIGVVAADSMPYLDAYFRSV